MSEEKTIKKDVPIKPGMTVRVHEKIKEKNAKGEEKERTQIFEGIVLAHKHNKEIGNTITVRKIASGVGVEKIFPLNSPSITQIKPVKQAAVKRAKLDYLRKSKKKLTEVKI
ncbi:MAG: 50S ribosomal protein L19 [Candidatus Komeilibacteria bacterium CG11_big_fil_rev_8_21_14_0_20_36_20]|uniref:50S ribosomal protein L19 n=1 Tax=Candidatus Komeilibacteria bacterium CG11_big_fil_rev_8_21_14_0_20_36_20 TaxID=1974477 RepID=A0A2H0NCC1_9BACT|nr:MAG: 50S ribosomal protein L19 [Candidatus Komeilibacteria bacterium CG11_big_fil_rev_8_21_14_0_20_36_20]PIR81777.1 MAG: 50S ribosomal protein L19 [Candidatus Komeilibacteria bacterium CG10_big_fil_rev_8_21_14_0_10_36_65]PJC55802.1 MAG: 50S ribosomal protein L19 [Candidatus Komeilibacteria bacterium CG_4_9_14_0_2_um_filter_36_13]